MKRLTLLALAAVLALGFSTPVQAGYDFPIVNPEYSPNQLTLRTDTDSINCYIPAADTTHGKPVYIPCANFAAVGSQTFTGPATFNSTVGVTGLLTATGGVSGVIGATGPAAGTFTTLNASGVSGVTGNFTASTGTFDVSPAYSATALGNPIVKATYGTCTVAAVNAGTCTILTGVASRVIELTNFDIIAVGSAATCTGVLLEDTNGTPVVASTLAAATLTNGAHNVPLTATLGVGFGAGTGLTSGAGLQLKVNGSGCTTTTAFQYMVSYAIH